MRVLALTRVLAIVAFVACSSAVPPTAPTAMLVDGGTPPAAGAGVMGRWLGVGHGVSGSVRFTVKDGVGRLDFSDDFTLTDAPGPFVYLNTTNNANKGTPLRISALKSNRGAQSYTFQMPAGAVYTWVLLWCDPFNVALAETQIPPTP